MMDYSPTEEQLKSTVYEDGVTIPIRRLTEGDIASYIRLTNNGWLILYASEESPRLDTAYIVKVGTNAVIYTLDQPDTLCVVKDLEFMEELELDRALDPDKESIYKIKTVLPSTTLAERGLVGMLQHLENMLLAIVDEGLELIKGAIYEQT